MKVKLFTKILTITITISLGISNIAFAASDHVESEASQVENPIESEIPVEIDTDEFDVPVEFQKQINKHLSETEKASSVSEITVENELIATDEAEITESLTEPNSSDSRSDHVKTSGESENNIQASSDIIFSQSEQPAQVGDTFSTTFGIYQILTVGEKPTAMLIDKAQSDPNGNFIYGDTSKPWTASYKNVEYSVTEIGKSSKLTGISGTISIPEGVTYIHNGALSKAAARRIDLPASLVHFDEDHTLHKLELITVAEGNQYYKVEDGALLSKDGTRLILYPAMYQNDSYTSPESVLSVEEDAFYNNAFLKTITLTKVTTIKDYAFYEMHSIETIMYPKTLTNLSPKYVTFNCFTLKQIFVEKGNPILYDENGILFFKNENEYMLVVYPASYPLDEYCIPYGVKSISSFAFNGITHTKMINIPATVNNIYSYAFEETQIPIEFILQFSSPIKLSQSAFDRLARGSKLYVETDKIKNGFLKDFLTTNINENGGTKIDTETPVIVDYEKAVSRIENWYLCNNKKYYYDISGNLVVGLQQINQYKYYFGEDHIMKTGFQDADGKTYYFFTDTGKMLTNSGIESIDNKLYFIKTDHSIYKKAELTYDNKIYYLNTNTGEIICDSLSHSFGPWQDTIAATCTKGGSQSHTCLKCNHIETRTLSKLQHQFNDWIILTEPNCTSQGIKMHTCHLCHTSEQQIINKSSHRPGKWIINRQPTCQSNGKKLLTCNICTQLIQYEDIQRLPHKYGNWKIKRQATYVRTGNKTRTCSICGKTDLIIIPKLLRKNISKAITSSIKQRTYNGRSQKPSIKLILNNKLLKMNADYSINYKNNKKPGKASIIIKGKRNYYGTKNLNFYIAPKAPTIRSLSCYKKKSLSLRIKKAFSSSGYQFTYSLSRTFKNKKTTNFSGTSKTINHLSSNKIYYIKIRAYKKIGRKKIFGPYSKTSKVLIK